MEEEGEMVQEVKDWKKTIKRTFIKARHASLPTVILDAKDPSNSRFLQNAEKLWSHCQIMDDFECKDFETTKTEMDKLKSDHENFKLNAENEMKQLLKEAEEYKMQTEEYKRQMDEKLNNAWLQAKQNEDA